MAINEKMEGISLHLFYTLMYVPYIVWTGGRTLSRLQPSTTPVFVEQPPPAQGRSDSNIIIVEY